MFVTLGKSWNVFTVPSSAMNFLLYFSLGQGKGLDIFINSDDVDITGHVLDIVCKNNFKKSCKRKIF